MQVSNIGSAKQNTSESSESDINKLISNSETGLKFGEIEASGTILKIDDSHEEGDMYMLS